MNAVKAHAIVAAYVANVSFCARTAVQLANLAMFFLTIIIAEIFYQQKSKWFILSFEEDAVLVAVLMIAWIQLLLLSGMLLELKLEELN